MKDFGLRQEPDGHAITIEFRVEEISRVGLQSTGCTTCQRGFSRIQVIEGELVLLAEKLRRPEARRKILEHNRRFTGQRRRPDQVTVKAKSQLVRICPECLL